MVDHAALSGAGLMEKLIVATRVALRARESTVRDLRERDAISVSLKLLHSHEKVLQTNYPHVLRAAFRGAGQGKHVVAASDSNVHFDELELMDELQVHSSVVMARAQQSAMMAAEAALAELNTLVCGALGLKVVRPDKNPLRPEIYVGALKEVVEQLGVPLATQLDWLGAMSIALGQELRALYLELSSKLHKQGVAAAGYAVTHTPTSGSVGKNRVYAGEGKEISVSDSAGTEAGRADAGQNTVSAGAPAGIRQAPGAKPTLREPVRSIDPTLLTLDKLRRLLAGELEPGPALSSRELFAQQFARTFDDARVGAADSTADFQSTVPAAFEALQEMQQVDQVVQRLEQRQGDGVAHDPNSVAALRQNLRSGARGVAQALSLEVVTLMVDNIARDGRLLEPVQRLVRSLEPSLLQLALVDVRFFTDKLHPARVLLQEITHRSLAYESVEATGFEPFREQLEKSIEPLLLHQVDSAAPFEQVLSELQAFWRAAEKASAKAREDAVQVLQHVESRNVLAEKIAHDIMSHPDAASVPPVVLGFLCGPWAQVVAQARILGGTGSGNADKYQAFISALLWSTHPELTRKNIAKLTRLVPLLLTTLREGLETIRYPATRTSAFLEALMGLHQLAFKTASAGFARKAEPAPIVAAPLPPHVNLVEDGNPWVAPQEAHASNFMELPEAAESTPSAVAVTPLPGLRAEAEPVSSGDVNGEPATIENLALGTWVELLVNGQWVRTQLTWASPHATLFLFTSVFGTTQSMTRRSRDKLVASGNLRVISGQTVVDSALDAVAQVALRNSMDIEL